MDAYCAALRDETLIWSYDAAGKRLFNARVDDAAQRLLREYRAQAIALLGALRGWHSPPGGGRVSKDVARLLARAVYACARAAIWRCPETQTVEGSNETLFEIANAEILRCMLNPQHTAVFIFREERTAEDMRTSSVCRIQCVSYDTIDTIWIPHPGTVYIHYANAYFALAPIMHYIHQLRRGKTKIVLGIWSGGAPVNFVQ